MDSKSQKTRLNALSIIDNLKKQLVSIPNLEKNTKAYNLHKEIKSLAVNIKNFELTNKEIKKHNKPLVKEQETFEYWMNSLKHYIDSEKEILDNNYPKLEQKDFLQIDTRDYAKSNIKKTLCVDYDAKKELEAEIKKCKKIYNEYAKYLRVEELEK